MSDHHMCGDRCGQPSQPLPVIEDVISGQLLIPATDVTTLLRSIAASWTVCGCGDEADRRSAAFHAGLLTRYADQLETELIALVSQDNPAG